MFKMFLTGVLSFLSMVALTRINGTLEWPNLWFGLLCGAASFLVTKLWFKILKSESELAGKPNASGVQKIFTTSNVLSVFIGVCGFLFSLLD